MVHSLVMEPTMDGEFCQSGARGQSEFRLIGIGIGIDISFSKFGNSVGETGVQFLNKVNLLVRVILGVAITGHDLAGQVVILEPLGIVAANSTIACSNNEVVSQYKVTSAPTKPAWRRGTRNSATIAKPRLRHVPAPGALVRLVFWIKGHSYAVINVPMKSAWR